MRALAGGRRLATSFMAGVALLASGCGTSATSVGQASGTPSGSAAPSLTGLAVEVIAGSSGPFDAPVGGPTGPRGFSGDGGPATKAQFAYPVGLSIDRQGNLFIADLENNRIRRITLAGIIDTVAGSGTSLGFAGDGGPAIQALLSGPEDVKVDGSGNLFIADSGNNRIRKVDTHGVITTIAGTGNAATSGDGGLAIKAAIEAPDAIAVGLDGTIYFSTPGRVRRIAPGGTITTIAGNGTPFIAQPPPSLDSFSGDGKQATAARFSDASAMKIDAAGNLYLADFLDCRVLRVDSKGLMHVVAGIGCDTFEGTSAGDGGPAPKASLARPADMEVGADGRLYILEHFGKVRVVDTKGIIGTLDLAWRYEEALGMTIHDNAIYITDRDHMAIIKAPLP